MRAMFVRLGCDQPTATFMTNDQGINGLDSLKRFDKEMVHEMCKTIKRSTRVVPGAGANDPDQRVPYVISILAEENVVWAAYMARHYEKISRQLPHNTVTVDSVQDMKDYGVYEKVYECATTIPKIDKKDWPTTFDKLQQHIRNMRGDKSKLPLFYVLRENAEVPPAADDPQLIIICYYVISRGFRWNTS